MQVGIRELKAKLSEYVRAASGGEVVIVTERGRPVARLTPYDTGSAVEEGIDAGWIDPPRRTSLSAGPRHPAAESVMDVLDEDRG